EICIIARKEQVVPGDREKCVGPSAQQSEEVVAAVRKDIPETDAIIFEVYGKGFLSTALVLQIADAARSAGKIFAADPNPRNLVEWRGLTVIKPNLTEAFLAAGIPSRDTDTVPSHDADLKRVGETLL